MEHDQSLDGSVIQTSQTSETQSHENTTSDELQGSTTSDPLDTFTAAWGTEDAALLRPSNLPLSRPLRAWERAPKSPFARKQVRVAKVWKRPVQNTSNAANAAADSSPVEGPASKRSKGRRALLQTPTKAVKKMCLNNGYGIAPQVLSWESRVSPARKIVTRSNGVAHDLVALPDEKEDEHILDVADEDNVAIEYLDEQGATLEKDNDSDKDQWEDDESDSSDTPIDDALIHTNDATSNLHAHEEQIPQTSSTDPETSNAPEDKDTSALTSTSSPTKSAPLLVGPTKSTLKPAVQLQTAPLPSSFVSPVKRRVTIKERKAAVANKRRRTLPVEFAPVVDAEEFDIAQATPEQPTAASEIDGFKEREYHATPQASVDESEDPNLEKTDEEFAGKQLSGEEHDQPEVDASPEQDSEEWEDVEDVEEESPLDPSITDRSIFDEPEQDVNQHQENQLAPLTRCDSFEGIPNSTEPPFRATAFSTVGKEGDELDEPQDRGSTPQPDSNSFSSPAKQLAIRMSPRRKSTSPLKRTSIVRSREIPHYLAFTPLKTMPKAQQATASPIASQSEYNVDNTVSTISSPFPPIERSTSAPPEEPTYKSPKRQPKPRVSDDTALLQAFLSRAAESKSGERRQSVSKRESLENRRDSDSVRNALASTQLSPPEPKPVEGVLGEMDPNSPSPRKASAVAPSESIGELTKKSNLKRRLNKLQSSADLLSPIDPLAQDEASQRPTRASRRSAREKRARVDLQETNSGPNKISLRANSDPVVLKKTDAQELAQLTRNNTRKNKGGAIMPTQRLIKLAAGEKPVEMEGVEGVTVEEVDARDGRVRWRAVLAEYSDAPGEPGGELLQLSETGDVVSQSSSRSSAENDSEEVEIPAPAPCDTPSKPKSKRSLATKSAPASAEHQQVVTPADATVDETVSHDAVANLERTEQRTKQKSASLKRLSRIATPAKKQQLPDLTQVVPSITHAQQLPGPQTTTPNPAPSTSTKQAPFKRKAPTSRLPAPASHSHSLGQGKENGTHPISSSTITPGLSSPPKKNLAPPASLGPSNKPGLGTKFDFAAPPPSKLQLSRSQSSMNDDEPLGLKSPARKGGLGRRVFAGGGSGAEADSRGGSGGIGADSASFLFSPAKKRSVRRLNG